MSGRWVPVTEVAERLHISRPTALKRLRGGEIPGLTDHYGYQRVDREVFEKWLVSEGSGKSGKVGNLTEG